MNKHFPHTSLNKWAMSYVHKSIKGPRLLTQWSLNQRDCSSISVHRPSFPPVISLVAPTFIRPSSDGGGMFDGGTGCACVVFRDRICHIAAIGFCCSATAAYY